MNDAGAGRPEAAPAYGGFRLGRLQLALPMAALREVVPCGPLHPLPCPAACVIGGIDLRGVVVPVLDLRIALGHDVVAAPMPSVIVMVHGGNVLGLLADGVTGVFASSAGMPDGITLADASESLFSGCVQSDDGSTLSVLSPGAVARLPRVPMVRDPEPGRQSAGGASVEAVGLASTADAAVPMMLMCCGPVALAIDAMAVHSTLADPRVTESALSRGHCRGVVDCAGTQVPAIDLLALCGLGSLDAQAPRQAFVVRIEAGMVAFLIGRVLDIVPTRPGDVIALPAFALHRPSLFAGVLPSSVLPAEAGRPAPADAAPYLLLDSHALRCSEEVVALASTGRPSSLDAAGDRAGEAARSMLTYDLGVETATPLDQVSEILPYTAASPSFETQGSVLGVLVNRGRSIPLLCLGRLTAGGSAVPAASTASVLVVESEGELLGFVVPGLKAIEPTRWAPEVRGFGPRGEPAPDDVAGAARCRQLALVGAGPTERMLPVLDLQRMALAIRSGAAQAPAVNHETRLP